MRYFFNLLVIALGLLQATSSYSQAIPSNRPWNAKWIAAAGADNGRNYGVYYFRKNVEFAAKPAAFKINVSGDNRYKLYVNGTLVSLGPARGDTYFWNYETVDLAPYLTAGKNTVSALVFNEAEFAPEAQMSLRTAFIIQGASKTEEILNTDNTWKCLRDKGHYPIPGFFAASVGELVDMNYAVKGWTGVNFNDTAWPAAANISDGKLKGVFDGFGWHLVPSSLPQMELVYQRIPVVRKAEGIKVPASFPAKKTTVTIPANTTATLLLDQTVLTNAYVTLNFSMGKGAAISLRYAESLYDNVKLHGTRKGNRDAVEGKDFVGRKDSLISNGGPDQTYTSLNYRTYRYIKLVVQTKNDALVIDDLYGTFTGYPFRQNAVLNTDNAEIKTLREIGWRTARLNAVETYMDCPYYEQLQYIGDTRIQTMISYYESGDDRLARNALNLMDHSRLAEGLTMSRYPSRNTQIISTFSLWYIGMLHDYWMYRPDSAFIKSKLTGARVILDYFSKLQQPDGSLKNTPYWTFVDGVGGKSWEMGSPKSDDGASAILDLQLLWAYQWQAEMEAKMGMPALAAFYNQKAEQLKQMIQRKYWSPAKMLYADTKEKDTYSQHANSLAILTGMVTGADMTTVSKKMLSDTGLVQCTIYFKYYLHQALVKAGLGNDYMSWLDIWRGNLKLGLTTWAEDSNLEYARSDCHAWGSSPNIEFFRTILGIDTDAPGFSRIKIEPHLGNITNISGEIPHPNGKVAVGYTLDKGKWKINISIPQNTSAVLVWKAKKYVLKAGENSLVI